MKADTCAAFGRTLRAGLSAAWFLGDGDEAGATINATAFRLLGAWPHLSFVLHRRQAQGHLRPRIDPALQAEAAARLLDQRLHDRQAKAGALLAARMRIVGLSERF